MTENRGVESSVANWLDDKFSMHYKRNNNSYLGIDTMKLKIMCEQTANYS